MATLDIPGTIVALNGMTLVGSSSTAISVNDGDTSYVHFAHTGGGFRGYNLDVNFPATTLPGSFVGAELVVVSKGNDSRAVGEPVGMRLILFSDSPLTFANINAESSDDWVETVSPILDELGHQILTQSLIESGTVEYNPGYALFNDGSSTSGWHTYITYIALRITYNELTPCDTWVDLDLSEAVFLYDPSAVDTGPQGQYDDGVIFATDAGPPSFYFPGLILDATRGYKVEITFDPDSAHDAGGRDVTLGTLPSGSEQATFEDGDTVYPDPLYLNALGGDVQTAVIGPGIGGWDDESGESVADGWDSPWFQTDDHGAISSIRIRKVCTVVTPPLIHWPRNDALGASSARVLWPPPKTEQASNLRGPSAIL